MLKPYLLSSSFLILICITNNESVSAEFIRVKYDIEKAAKTVEESRLPDEYTVMLRKAF